MSLILALAAAMQSPPVLRQLPMLEPRPTASAPLNDGTGRVIELYITGDRATLFVKGTLQQQAVSDPQLALMLLADKRMQPLWQPLLDWAGPGLERMRDRRLAAVRALAAQGGTTFATTTAASSVRPKMRATLLLVDELAAAGLIDEAIATVKAARGAKPGGGDWGKAEWMAASVRLHTLTRKAVGIPAAIAVLDQSEALLGSKHPYSINFQINRAADLAESARYAEALTVLDAAEMRFADPQGTRGSGGERVPGSDRQFAWIRICALNGLGRGAENASLVQTLYPAADPTTAGAVAGPGEFYIPGTSSIRYRLFRCMNNVTGLADELAADAERNLIGGTAFLQLQPAFSDPEKPPSFYRQLAAQPRMATAIAGRFRVLPASLTPALNRWRGAPSTPPAR